MSLELGLSPLLYELSPSEDAQQVRLLHKVLPYLWKQKLGLQGGQAVSSPNLMHLPLQLLLQHLRMFDVVCSHVGPPDLFHQNLEQSEVRFLVNNILKLP